MDQARKKALKVKIRAAGRTLKEYKSYKQQVQGFDMNQVHQDKKKAQFYNESTSALESAKKSLVQFMGQLTDFQNENKQEIQEIDDADLKEQIQKGKVYISEAKGLLPADI